MRHGRWGATLFHRAVFTLTIVSVTLFVTAPAGVAGRRAVGSIIGVDMVPAVVTDGCGVTMSGSFADISSGRYTVEFRVHSQTFGTTGSIRRGLRVGQISVSETMTVCPVGDTWDRLDVVLYRGAQIVDTDAVVKTIVCPPR